tara:strand:- start:457 stop:1158 length:702 start_codon:yes stop_codon:yes gene_type:complete
MNSVNLIITGPIRPNIDYVNNMILYFKTLIKYDSKVFLGYWKNEDDDYSNKIKNVDYFVPCIEPDDDLIYKNIYGRTIQQNQLNGKIEHWTPRTYKMFYGIKQMVEFIDNKKLIHPEAITLRIRTDLFVANCYQGEFNKLIFNMKQNSVYNRIRRHPCDWFTISSYDVFKKIWFIATDDEYNKIIEKIYNAEDIIKYKSELYKINIFDIKKIIDLGICRKYDIQVQTYDNHNI